MIQKKPYKIISKLIEQPTWGGSYISSFKSLRLDEGKKIGQSYELSGESLIVNALNPQTSIADIVSQFPEQTLGKNVFRNYQKMPLLIKFTQSLGNSFQLHVQEKNESTRWKAKPESWYFFEEGLITLGLNPKTDIEKYKDVCLKIEDFMKQLSTKIKNKTNILIDAKKQAHEYIEKLNPYQFVNTYHAKKGLVVDLSEGGVHHSWEESRSLPLGNIVFEIQLDVNDSSSTLRSFDKGKILNDGSIRPLTIKDYFTYINTSPSENLFSNLISEKREEKVLKTKHYCLDEILIAKQRREYIEDSFVHLFVKEGCAVIEGNDGSVTLKRGASCFIPFCIGSYSLTPLSTSSTVLKTHISFN